MLSLLLLLPLFGFVGASLFGRHLGRGAVFFTSAHIFAAFSVSFYVFCMFYSGASPQSLTLGSWISSDSLEVSWELYLDGVNSIMCCVVTFVSFLVHVYSGEYMGQDPHLPRFMSYLSLFTFFMMVLVTGGNFIQMFVGWEGVGLSSYLLINFWFTRLQANKAAIKAMLFNRVADFIMILALCAIFMFFETFDYLVIFSVAPLFLDLQMNLGSLTFNAIDFICCTLFLGAMGKSAQLGFHNWLPDAMEGPTPVSALIHAATMVTAGVFLLIRCSPLFENSESALLFVAIVGAVTALFGSSVGMYSHDLKRVIAFSTCSQLGYMMMACGISQYSTALFHLVTHAFFKALLFLAAGSIIHAAFDEQDTRKMGGFLRYLPLTYSCFLIGSLNLIGTPFLGGFYTKDMILELAASSYEPKGLFCYILGVVSVFFTAAYSARSLILIFLVNNNSGASFAKATHESGLAIRLPLVLLSLISVVSGWIGADLFYGLGTTFFGTGIFYSFQNSTVGDAEFLFSGAKFLPLLLTIIGSLYSFVNYLMIPKIFRATKETSLFRLAYFFSLKKWYSDRVVNQLIALPFLGWSKNYVYSSLDRGLLERIGPSTVSEISYMKLYKIRHYY